MSNPSAFPTPGLLPPQRGLTALDYFAAKAMQGLLASGYSSLYPEGLCSRSYNVAEAMLAERERRMK